MRSYILKKVVMAYGLLALAELLFPIFGRELFPSRLTVHAPQQGWRSVALDGNPMAVTGKANCIVPILYGSMI